MENINPVGASVNAVHIQSGQNEMADSAIKENASTELLQVALIEEYKILTTHYCHEDVRLKKTITLFASLNAGLLGIREWRNFIVLKMTTVEVTLKEAGSLTTFGVMREEGFQAREPCLTWYNCVYIVPYRFFRSLPASITYLSLPTSFAVIWVVLIVIGLRLGPEKIMS